MDIERIMRRHELVSSDVYKALREEALNYIVTTASSPMDENLTKGALLLINYFDSWERTYIKALEKRKES